jgi:hypothetical protein
MTPLEEKYIQQLRCRKLFVSEPFSARHKMANGVWIAKPASVEGNHVNNYKSSCDEIPINAPAVLLLPTEQGWMVLNQEHIPTSGPGDFKNVWQTQQEAVDDILDFYFGNPARMDAVNKRFNRL